MATLANNSTGNFTTAATWSLVNAASLLNSETGTTNSSTTFTNSSQFTPGAITIGGIGLKISSRTSGSGATFSVRLVTGGGAAGTTTGTAVAGTTVTVNVSDMSVVSAGWYFFKFSSSVTLAGATLHNVQVQSSTAAHVTLYRDATASNWSRFLRTTTTQAPVAADNLIVIGDLLSAGSSTSQTVTMDNTAATTFGVVEVGGRGVLSYGTTASTAYQLRLAGNLDIGAGSLLIGTSGTPIPSTSSAALEFVVGSNVQYGLRARGDGTLTTYGNTKTGRAYLAADASAAATSLTTDISTSWISGDSIVIASTTRTASETELVTLGADASGTSLPTVSALASAHSGTSPTRAELANFTRNVKIFGQSTSLQTFVFVAATSIVSLNYTEFYFMGSNVANSRGIDINTSTGSLTLAGCAIRNFEVTNSIGLFLSNTAGANTSVSDCVFYRCAVNAISVGQTTATTISFNNVWVFANVTSATNGISNNMQAGTFTNITVVGIPGAGAGIIFGGNDIISSITVNNLTTHSNGGIGIFLSSIVAIDSTPPTFSTITSWRNSTRGINITNSMNFILDGMTLFGNATSGIVIIGSVLCADLLLKNITANAGTTLTQPIGFEINGNNTEVYIENSSFGATTTHATGDVSVAAARTWCQTYFRNCLFSSATELANQTTNMLPGSFIGSASHDQVVGASKAWRKSGIITKDTVIYDTTSVGTSSTRLTPSSATLKLESPDKNVIVKSGKSIKLSVKVRWSSTIFGDSANFNGSTNGTRLWQRKNPAIGVTSDTLLSTLLTAPTNPFGTFVTMTGTTAVATDDGVCTFFLDIDGTTGWINIDTYQVEVI